MPKYKVSVISLGEIIQNLYSRLYSKNWWISCSTNNNATYTVLYLIHLDMKTRTTINQHDFIITVVQDSFEFGYLYQYEALQSNICKSSLVAATSKFNDKEAIIKIYYTFQKMYDFHNTDLNTVWNKIGILTQYTGSLLFGLEHEQTKLAINKEQTLLSLLQDIGCTDITTFEKESTILHIISHYVHLGFDITEESDIELAIEEIHKTSVAYLEPKQNKGNKSNI
ncbi:6520_t:CDS:2, partial [Cetraspora pellucida]